MKKKPSPYSERMTVNLTPNQMRRLEELRNVRSRMGHFVSKNDLVRDAVNYYLTSGAYLSFAMIYYLGSRIKTYSNLY